MGKTNLFFTINDGYAQHCCVTMTSVLEHNPDLDFAFYVLSDYISDENRRKLGSLETRYGNCKVHIHIIDDSEFRDMSINIAHISHHTYYRYIIAELFPQLDKALYLDVDIVVKGSLAELWAVDLSGFLCAGTADVWVGQSYYKPEIGLAEKELYINAGVLLLNLEQMRREGIFRKLCDKTREMEGRNRYQDQDVINVVCCGRIKELPAKYNFATENAAAHPQQRAGAVIVHYTGERKPWSKKRCCNPLKGLYFENLAKTPYCPAKYEWMLRRVGYSLQSALRWKTSRRQLRVALIVDEFFGGAGTAYGGYGFLARHYIAKYIPCDDIKIDVLLGQGRGCRVSKTRVDKVDVYQLPSSKFIGRWLKKRKYDLYFSIEMTNDLLCLESESSRIPLLLWVQDPRPWTEWLEIQTVKLFPEKCYWSTDIYEMVHRLWEQGRARFVTQGRFLIENARNLYRLPEELPISYLPNPIDIDPEFSLGTHVKKNWVIFVGRIESVKRGWLFCEIAKRMPEYEFYMIGQTFREKDMNDSTLLDYRESTPNLHFTGHLEGEEKFRYIRDAKVLVNTSIHEALPVTFLEAMAYGTLLVSCRNPENLTRQFGVYTGPVLGDGFDKVDLFVDGIRSLIENEGQRKELAQAAYDYVKQVHNVEDFIRNTRHLIRETAARH